MSLFNKIKKMLGIKPKVTPVKIKVPTTQVELQIDIVVESYIDECLNLLNLNPNRSDWQKIFKAIAFAESSFNVAERYVETELGKDAVTGKQNTSEGLFQMSYQDAKYHQCEFDWNVDKYKDHTAPEKTIFNIRRNTECAMKVLDKLVAKHGDYIFDNGHYWAVLKPSNKRHKVFLDKLHSYYV
jgi:hypothetical protein